MRSAGKIAAAAVGSVMLITAVVGAGAGSLFSAFGSSQPSARAIADIPAGYLNLYAHAATTCPGLDWSVLAAIGKVETDHGRSSLPGVHSGANSAGARGPMQFLLSTFTSVVARHPNLRSGTNPPSPYDPYDAVYAAAAYLCDSGARDAKNIPGAIKAYNHDDVYVSNVLVQAQAYSQRAPNSSVSCASLQSTVHSGREQFSSNAALTSVRFACAQVGKPYVWGGTGDPGFDCSGLTRAAYAAAGMGIPRVAQAQYDAGPRLAAGAPLRPGDLVFFGTPNAVHHVGISLGGSLMINAPRPGRLVRVQAVGSLPDFVGATRPAGGSR
ncbi:NlpC/P60 family protein [Streptomyces sp. NBC_00079]|uniref:C40 family peptidase n=1 Tax=Streptomyces sp. NBC_00079 TaxID=2975644 RepID=UPI0032473A3F